jgi:hypothetical protein
MGITDRPENRPPGFKPPQYPIPPAYTPPPIQVKPPSVAPVQPPQMTQLPDNIVGYFMLLLGL